jgi:transposase-like protein
MHAFYPTNARISNPHRMDHEARIQAAITDLESQDCKNYAAIARKWEIDRSTLSRRHRGGIGPNRDATSYVRRQLTDT